MSAKQIILHCNHRQRQLLSQAIRAYVAAAYPPGGSECAQAAREALLNAALDCDAVAEAEMQLLFSRRMRSFLRAAMQYFAEQPQRHQRHAEIKVLLEEL